MKNELKISMLSVVCVMCATVVMPAFSASSVRSLGGVGTYNGASSAAAAKSGGNSSVDMSGSVRAGSMRVNNVSNGVAGATRVGSTRAATTPRLSIGKYLSGSSVISGGSSTQGGVNVGGSSNSGNDLRDRVAALEGFVDFKASGETLAEQLSAVKLDVEGLKEDLKNVTGFVTDVVFDEATGDLFVSVDGQQLPPYKLSDYFDGRVKEALQAVLDDITDLNGRLSDYYTKDETDAILANYATRAELPSIDGLVDAAALTEVQEALQAAIDAKLESDDLLDINAAIELLKTNKADASVVERLKASLKTISDDYAKKSELDAVELRLQNAINAIDIPSLDAYATKQFVADNYVTLESAKTFALSADVQGIVSALAEKALVSDVEAIDGRVQVLEKAGYQTSAQVQGLITTASEDYVKKGAESQVVPSMLDLGAAGEATSGYMMLQAKSDGTSEWVNVVVD